MGRSGKGLTNSLTIRTKIPNNKQKERNNINNQYLRKLIKEFKNLPYPGNKKKQVHNEPNESYFFLNKHVSKLIKINKNVRLRTKRVKLDINGTKYISKTIGHINEENKSVMTPMSENKLESINVKRTCNNESNKQK